MKHSIRHPRLIPVGWRLPAHRYYNTTVYQPHPGYPPLPSFSRLNGLLNQEARAVLLELLSHDAKVIPAFLPPRGGIKPIPMVMG